MLFFDYDTAYVVKFIVPEEISLENASNLLITHNYNGELLKIDKLYPVTLENIIALKDGNDEEKNIFERFNDMFFLKKITLLADSGVQVTARVIP